MEQDQVKRAPWKTQGWPASPSTLVWGQEDGGNQTKQSTEGPLQGCLREGNPKSQIADKMTNLREEEQKGCTIPYSARGL